MKMGRCRIRGNCGAMGVGIFLFFLMGSLSAQELRRDLFLAKTRMNGEDVRQLQNKLLALGFKEVGSADGWFGPNTDKGVRAYQEFIGCVPDGKVTKNVWAFLFSKDPRTKDIEEAIGAARRLTLEGLIKQEQSLEGVSTEGGTLVRYTKDSRPIYTEVAILGEMGKVIYKIYHVSSGHIIVEDRYTYPEPFAADQATRLLETHYVIRNVSVTLTKGTIAPFDLASSGIDPQWLR
ncbi:MAG: peptidoglycan-binding protein [Treponemataceae bacterium]|nr:peptidoglycan-binding protein [Treponemataceae bacterium]